MIKKIRNIKPIVLINVILVLSLVCCLVKILNNKNYINIFGFKFVIAEYSNSEPKISKGDLIIAKANSNLQEGNTVVFEKANTIITHKISSIINTKYGKEFKTKGIDNLSEDNWTLSSNDIYGVYKFRIIKFGSFLKLLSNKGFVICSVIIILLEIKLKIDINKKKKLRKIKKMENR